MHLSRVASFLFKGKKKKACQFSVHVTKCRSAAELAAGDLCWRYYSITCYQKGKSDRTKKLTFRAESKACLQFFGLAYDVTLPAELLLNQVG